MSKWFTLDPQTGWVLLAAVAISEWVWPERGGFFTYMIHQLRSYGS